MRPPITGLDHLGPDDGVHLLHSMGDTFAVMNTLTTKDPKTAIIIGAGYIGLEMAEGLTARGITVTQIEALPEVLPTVEPELGALVHDELVRNRVDVRTHTLVTAVDRTDTGALTVTTSSDGQSDHLTADLVLVVVGVRPDTTLAAAAGAQLGIKNTIAVDEQMRTNLSDVFAAGDAVLRAFADLVQDAVRQSDLVCRYGGEEFAFLFPEIGPAETEKLAERLRVRCAEMDVALPDGRQIKVSVSIGLADASECPIEIALKRADEALYEAKRLGRNRVVISGEPPAAEA